MKKMICCLLALLCLMSLCVCGGTAAASSDPAPAEEAEALKPYEAIETGYGFRFEYPEEYQNLKGELAVTLTSFGNNSGTMELYYVKVPEEERAAFRESLTYEPVSFAAENPEWMEKYDKSCIFIIQAMRNDDSYVRYLEAQTPLSYLEDNPWPDRPEYVTRLSIPVYLQTLSLDNGWKLVIQRNEMYTYDAEPISPTDLFWFADPDQREEAVSLYERPELFIGGLKAGDWVQYGQVGDRVSFETLSLEGETVTGDDLFSGHKVTMVNIWATWCGPCVAEMPQLEQLNTAFAQKDCQIIGLCVDAVNDEAKAEALAILEEAGVTYPNIILSPEMKWANVNVFPTSFFIAEDGTILTESVEGAWINSYSEVLDQALAQLG